MNEFKNLPVSPETHKRVVMLKAKSDFKNCDEIIAAALDALKEKAKK